MGIQSILSIVFPRTLTALKYLGLCCRWLGHWMRLLLIISGRMLQLNVQQQIRLPHELKATINAFKLLLRIATLHTLMIGDEIRRDGLKDALITLIGNPFQSMHGLLMLMQLIFTQTALVGFWPSKKVDTVNVKLCAASFAG